MKCEKCKFFDPCIDDGTCRRYPPKIDMETGWGAWPIVAMNDWCGEFKVGQVGQGKKDTPKTCPTKINSQFKSWT